MTNQTPYALKIPEVLREVFQHLGSDRKALYSASRVNKAWAEECLNVLWHHITVNGARLLASIPKHRRQFYADKIRRWTLDMSSTDDQYEICELDFPRLKRVDLWLTDDNSGYHHQLVPSLEEFRLHNKSTEAEDTLWELPRCCPNLRKLCVRSEPQIGFDGLEGYLKEFSKLRALDLTGMTADAMTDEVFFHLANLPLHELRMRKPITSEMVDLAYQRLGSGNLFPGLHYLEAKMEWCIAARLLPAMTRLRELRLDLVSSDTNHKTFQAIGTLTELSDLYLTTACQTGKVISREEVLAIGQLHKLRNLTILGTELTFDEAITEDDLVILFSSFPGAEDICIDAFNTNLIPGSATSALATTSTRLQHYTFKAIWDVTFAESSTLPLFSELQSMRYQHLFCRDIAIEG
ncbi:hypothetical protein KCU83_g1189, partial [Aureobasidium melanogenum]